MLRLPLPAGILAPSLAVGAALFCACDRGGEEPAAPAAPSAPEARLPGGLDAETAARPVAKVGETTITIGELAARIELESPYLRARYRSPERRRELLDQLIDFQLLAEEADRRGYDELPEVVRAEKQAMIEELVSQVFRERRDALEVSEAEVRAYYDAHPEEWSQPEQVRASHIRVQDRALAERILAELVASGGDAATWRRLSEAHHDDPATRAGHGDLRFFSRPEATIGLKVAEPIARAAFALEADGAIHGEPVRTDAGWHVVRRTAHRPELRRSLDEVRRMIENKLWREKQDAAVAALIATLRDKYRVEVHPERLDQVHVPTEGAR